MFFFRNQIHRSKRSESTCRVRSARRTTNNSRVERWWTCRVANYHTFAKKRKCQNGKYRKSEVSAAKRSRDICFRFAISTCFARFKLRSLFKGGPGSGKVTHCDTLMQEKRGVTHINMMDLLQQYAIGNGEFTMKVDIRRSMLRTVRATNIDFRFSA